MKPGVITCCFDFGNTRRKCAVFNGRELEEVVIMDDDRPETVHQLIEAFRPARTERSMKQRR